MKSFYRSCVVFFIVSLFLSGCDSYRIPANEEEIDPAKELAEHHSVQNDKDPLSVLSLASSTESQQDIQTTVQNEKQLMHSRPTGDETDAYSVRLSLPYYYFMEAQLLRKQGHLDRAIQSLNKSIAYDPESAYLKRELSLFYLQQRDTAGALQVVEQQLEKSPNDVELLFLYGRIKQGMGLIKDAQNAFETIIKNDPENENVYVFLGRTYMEENDLPNAFRVYEKMISNFPASYVGHFFLGKIYAAKGDMEAAEKAFQKTIALEPELEEPRFALLELYQSQGQLKKIIGMYQEILEKNPNNYRAAMELGIVYFQNGAGKDAEDIFTSLGEKNLSDPNVLRTLVQYFLEPEKIDDTIVILEGMAKGAPDDSEIHYIAGIAYDRKENRKMTKKHLEQVKSDSRFYKNAVVNLSIILQEEGKTGEAIQRLIEAIQASSQDPEFFFYLGKIYEDSGEYEKAVAALKQGIEIDPDNVNLRFRLGTVYDQKGLKEASIEEMKTVIRLDPKHFHALNYLGYTYADLGQNLDEAERLIKEALKYRPGDAYITDSLGWVYFKKGLIDQAVEQLEKAVHIEPNDPIILEHLGDAYLKANDRVKALELYQRSLHKKQEKQEDRTELEEKIRALTGDKI